MDKYLHDRYNIIIIQNVFEWDDNKNAVNKIKHGVTFEEASSVFYDEEALVITDDAHSTDEERFLILGMSSRLNVLVVCYCHRGNNEKIRIISARKATGNEERQYYGRIRK